MENKECSVIINNHEYVRKDELMKAEQLEGMPYQIVRTYSAGVFAGYIESRNGQEVVIRKARKIWYWDGAASLSQLAEEGTKKPENCKFPCEVDKILVTQAIEILDCTEKARKSIASVKIWQM